MLSDLISPRQNTNIPRIIIPILFFMVIEILSIYLRLYFFNLDYDWSQRHWSGQYNYFISNLLAGNLPLWNPFILGGTPLFIENYVYHYTDVCFYYVFVTAKYLPINDPYFVYTIGRVFSHFVFIVNAWFLFYYYGGSYRSSLVVTSILFLFSFYGVFHQNVFISLIVFAPLIFLFLLFSIHRVNERPKWFSLMLMISAIQGSSRSGEYSLIALVIFILVLRAVGLINFREYFEGLFRNKAYILTLPSIVIFFLSYSAPVFLLMETDSSILSYYRYAFHGQESFVNPFNISLSVIFTLRDLLVNLVDFYNVHNFYNGITHQERYIPVGLLFGLLPLLYFFAGQGKNKKLQTVFFIMGLLFLAIISDFKIISRVIVFATLGTVTSLEFFVLYFLLFWGLVLSYVLADWQYIVNLVHRKIYLPKWLIYFAVIFILGMGVNRNIELLSDYWRGASMEKPLDLTPQSDRTRRVIIPDKFQWWRVAGWVEREHEGPVIPYHGVFAPALKYGINSFFVGLQLTMMSTTYDLMKEASNGSFNSISGITLPMLRLSDKFVIMDGKDALKLLKNGRPNEKDDFLIIEKEKNIEEYLFQNGLIPSNETLSKSNDVIKLSNGIGEVSKVYTNMEIASLSSKHLTPAFTEIRPYWVSKIYKLLSDKHSMKDKMYVNLLKVHFIPDNEGSYHLVVGEEPAVKFHNHVYGVGSFELFFGNKPVFFRGLPSLVNPGLLREFDYTTEKILYFYVDDLNQGKEGTRLLSDETNNPSSTINYRYNILGDFQLEANSSDWISFKFKNNLISRSYSLMLKDIDSLNRFYSIAEVELLNNGRKVSKDNLRVKASSFLTEHPVDDIMDGDYKTFWHIGPEGFLSSSHWVNFRFDTPTFFDEIRLKPREDIPQQIRASLQVIAHETKPLLHGNFPDVLVQTIGTSREEPFRWQLSPYFYLDNVKKNQLTLLTYQRDEGKLISIRKNVKIIDFSPNHLIAEVNTNKNQLLYYADSYHKDWHAEIDGKPSRLMRANYAYKAVVIPAGKHSVKFYYDPKYAKIALKLFYFTLIVVPIWACLFLWVGRKK